MSEQVPEQTIEMTKTNDGTSWFAPLERGTITVHDDRAARLLLSDAERRVYLDRRIQAGKAVRFVARGSAGNHEAAVLDPDGEVLGLWGFRLQAQTGFRCNRGPYAKLAERLRMLLEQDAERKCLIINGRMYRMLVTWGRDHVHTLKAQKYFMTDVTSGMNYWLETQEENGMFWDCIHPNGEYPGRTWFGEVLGEGYFRYDDGGRYIVRRIPVEADCEFLYTEGVWHAWKATGDDEWMARQLPRLEKALKYNSSHRTRWSRKHQLVRRSFCQDSWDFAHPFYCNGDHRCINPGDPQFLFHGDNSGLYSMYWRMAEMYEYVGNDKRAAELREEGEALRQRANEKLFFGNVYGHMVPEKLKEEDVYARVGDERERMSLSTGYTLNRRMPTHEMAVKILKEYQRRGKAKKDESFAEWWTMDPPYTREQWPSNGPPPGEYTNGSVCPLVAGELARAAFDHGFEAYGAGIIDRLWDLSQRDGGEMHQAYRRLPENPEFPEPKFQHVDLRAVVNRGLRNGAHEGVEAWTSEGDNDMRNLPVGRRKFGPIEFDVIDPSKNAGRAVLRISPPRQGAPVSATIPVENLTGRSVYFMHTLAHGARQHTPVATYEIVYADGQTRRIFVRQGHEIGLWWGISDGLDRRRGNHPVDRSTTRVAWRGANPEWANVGLHMYGWNNPRPDVPITAIRVEAVENPGGRGGGLMLAAISFSSEPVQFDIPIRSYGLPSNWSQAAVFYAIAEGLAGIEDTSSAFQTARVSPRWTASDADRAEVTLHYPASDGYCTCRFRDDRKGKISLDLTGSFETAEVRCLMPKGKTARKVRLGRQEITFRTQKVEKSAYTVFALDELPTGPVTIEY